MARASYESRSDAAITMLGLAGLVMTLIAFAIWSQRVQVEKERTEVNFVSEIVAGKVVRKISQVGSSHVRIDFTDDSYVTVSSQGRFVASEYRYHPGGTDEKH